MYTTEYAVQHISADNHIQINEVYFTDWKERKKIN